MIIGVPKELKNHEHRVGLTPASVRECTHHGHKVIIQSTAGEGIGSLDAEYQSAGAKVVPTASAVYEMSDLIVKVKEPLPEERKLIRPGQSLFSYFHLAPDPAQTKGLIDSKAICIAYETVTSPFGGLPLLAPMSKVAGRMAVQAGAYCLEQPHGGLGMLLGGVPGVDPAKVVIIGGGVVGTHAAHIAVGMGADVWVIDRSMAVIENHWAQFGRSTNTVYSTQEALERHVHEADLIIGSVLIPGAAAPKLVSKKMIAGMKAGAVIVDVAIDQGGCFETSRPTTHADPTYIVDDVVHYCVTNMPGGVPKTSTFALNNATLPHILTLADKGVKAALLADEHLRNGLNICNGYVTNKPVADNLGYSYHEPADALATL